MSSSASKSDLKRLISYAKALNLVVKIKPYSSKYAEGAYYSSALRYICVHRKTTYTDTDVCLLLLHELAHHRDWLVKGKEDTDKEIDILQKQEDEDRGLCKLTKAERAVIRKTEYDGIKYMPIIAQELDLKMPLYKVLAEAELDMMLADYYYYTGKEPQVRYSCEQRKRLRAKYKKMKTPKLEKP